MPDGSSAALSFTMPIDWRETVETALNALQSAYPYHDTLTDPAITRTVTMYAHVAMDEGIAALGQSLTHFGTALYRVATGGDEYVFFLRPAEEKPSDSLPVIWEGDLADARLCTQAGRHWGDKARQMRSPKLDLVVDFWDEDGTGSIAWLTPDYCLWPAPQQTLVADVSRWDMNPEGVEHMILARFSPTSADGLCSLHYSSLPVSAPDGDKALWAISRFSQPNAPHQSGISAAYGIILQRGGTLLGECTLPSLFPPTLPMRSDARLGKALPAPPQPAEYRPESLRRTADGWLLNCHVSNQRSKGARFIRRLALRLAADLSPLDWTPRHPERDDQDDFPPHEAAGQISVASLPGLPAASRGWEISGTTLGHEHHDMFAMRAIDRATGQHFLRPLRGMQPRLTEYRYGQHVAPIALPGDWLLLDIRGDNFGLDDSAWLWHLPSDRFIAIPLGAISPYRENVDFHYNPSLDCLFAVNCSYDRTTALFRLIARPEMIARLAAATALQRLVPPWQTAEPA